MDNLQGFGWHLLCKVMPQLAIRIQYRHILKSEIDFNNPKDLNEKINYLKLHADLREWARLADKYAVRDYVKSLGIPEILVPLYGKYDTPQELIKNWDKFPEKFVIKANHGCGEVKLVTDKDSANLKELEEKMSGWLKDRYGHETMERHYLLIKPCLIVEKYLEEPGQIAPSDYKIWCFDGKPYCILAITDRDDEHHKRHRSMYNLDWRRIDYALPHNSSYGEEDMPKPKNLDKMLEYASKLTAGHKQVRMDMYNVEGQIYFGEMTFTAGGGYNFYNKQMLLELGRQFDVK